MGADRHCCIGNRETRKCPVTFAVLLDEGLLEIINVLFNVRSHRGFILSFK